MYLDPTEPRVIVDQLEAQALLRVLGATSDYGFSKENWQRFQSEHAHEIVSHLQDAARYDKYRRCGY